MDGFSIDLRGDEKKGIHEPDLMNDSKDVHRMFDIRVDEKCGYAHPCRWIYELP